MAKKLKLNVELNIPITILLEGDMYVAYTPAFDLSSCGETFEDAEANLREATILLIEECVRMGTLEDVLESCGWVKRPSKKWIPPQIVKQDLMRLPPLAIAA